MGGHFEENTIPVFDEILKGTPIPNLIPVEYHFPTGSIKTEDIPDIILNSISERNLTYSIKPGELIGITCGSREINAIDVITKAVVNYVKSCGGNPFIFPAMGSHGGATPEGQIEILESYGITEETMGCPIRATMEVVHLGETPDGLPVYLDKYADEADGIIAIGRIKPHTNFHGDVESGLMKMLVIGAGKQHGADICHSAGFENMPKNIRAIACEIIKKKNIVFGIGIVEDAKHGTAEVLAIPGDKIEEEEPAILKRAKALLPCIPFEKIDVLILEEIGKDISGTGMDPNVVGRSTELGLSKPYVERIAVLDLTDKSHHNCCGIGGADFTTKRLFDKSDFTVTYPNPITGHDPDGSKLPLVMPNDRNAIQAAIQTCLKADCEKGIRLVWMKNTLSIDSFCITEALIPDAKSNPDIKIKGGPIEVTFDEIGNITWLK